MLDKYRNLKKKINNKKIITSAVSLQAHVHAVACLRIHRRKRVLEQKYPSIPLTSMSHEKNKKDTMYAIGPQFSSKAIVPSLQPNTSSAEPVIGPHVFQAAACTPAIREKTVKIYHLLL